MKVFAQTPSVVMGGQASPYTLTNLAEIAANAAWVVFTIIVVICFVIAGILFLTSQGEPEKIKQARYAFIWGVAGVVVGVVAYSIIWIVESIFI